MPERTLGFYQIPPEQHVHLVRKGLSHGVSAQRTSELARGVVAGQDRPRLPAIDRFVPLARQEQRRVPPYLGPFGKLGNPECQRFLDLGVEQHGAPFRLPLHVLALHMNPVHDPPVLEHVADRKGEQLGDAKASFDAENEQGTIPERIPAAEAVAHLEYLGVGERASAFHGSTRSRGKKTFAPIFSLWLHSLLRPLGNYAIESLPLSTWRTLGIPSLPAKRRARPEHITASLTAIENLFPVQVERTPSHDELQALVAGLAGLAVERGDPHGYVAAGIEPRYADGTWREGYIVNPRAPAPSTN